MKKGNQVAILAGGLGTRLKERTGELPKPMALVLDKPIIQHQIELCRKFGFNRIVLLVHYGSEIIQNYFKDGELFGVDITYAIENEPRGTAGALLDALHLMDDTFFVLYGDTYADVDLQAMWDHHIKKNVKSVGTLFLHPNDHPQDSDLVEVCPTSNRIKKIHSYPHKKISQHRNLVNAALYILEKDPLNSFISKTAKSDLAKNTFPDLLNAGFELDAYISPEYIKDMGTPDRIDKVSCDIMDGLPERLSNRGLRSCVFFDRDGTLNEEVNHLTHPEQLILLPGVGNAIRQLNRSGVLAVGVTNQPVIARGEVSFEGMEIIHSKLDYLLGLENAYLDKIYYCPHHPDSGYLGEVPELKIHCNCRKPYTGLVDRAVNELKIDRRSSWFIGDTTVDIETGYKASLRTILIRTGYGGADHKYNIMPDYIVPSLPEAVNWILKGHEFVSSQLFDICAQSVGQRIAFIGGPSRAGKSFVAQVFKEMLLNSGRTAHVISLDSWLMPVSQRIEGSGIKNRYDLNKIMSIVKQLLLLEKRCYINIPTYDRRTRNFTVGKDLSIGPNDFLIIEGVPALLLGDLLKYSDIKIYVDVPDDVRHQRLLDEYRWRCDPEELISQKISSREIDELPTIRETVKNSNYQINTFIK